jgi:cytochrome c biogenesis factor
MVEWIWLGGLIAAAGGLIALWPAPRAARRRAGAAHAAHVRRELSRA